MSINEILKLIFLTIRDSTYWIFAIIMLIDILRHGAKHDVEGCVKSLMYGAIGYLCIFVILNLLDTIKNMAI